MVTAANKWTVDEHRNAQGHATIRHADGTPNGDTERQPIATVYDQAHASLIAVVPEMRELIEWVSKISPYTDRIAMLTIVDRARGILAKIDGTIQPHKKVIIGKCATCGHYGDDCKGDEW